MSIVYSEEFQTVDLSGKTETKNPSELDDLSEGHSEKNTNQQANRSVESYEVI